MNIGKIWFRPKGVFSLGLLSVVAVGSLHAADFYVSIDGSARADGSIDRPYGSIAAAVDAVRGLRKSGDTDPAVIYLRAGRHQVNETLVLKMEDGNPSSAGMVTLGVVELPKLSHSLR